MPVVDSRRRLGLAGAASVLLAVTLGLGSAATATASDPTDIAFFPPATITVGYGENWSLDFSSYVCNTFASTFRKDGAVYPYTPQYQYPYIAGGELQRGAVMTGYESRPLVGGSYQLTVTTTAAAPYLGYPYQCPSNGTSGVTATPATIVVTPAALGLDLRVIADPNAESNAIVSARFTGDFVDSYEGLANPWAPLPPTGTWFFEIADETGDVVFSKEVEKLTPDDSLATSLYWTEAKPGETYSARATFAPAGENGTSFTAAESTPFSYTAPNSVVKATDPSVTPAPVESSQSGTGGVEVPVWIIAVIGLLMALAAVLATIFIVRYVGRTVPRPTHHSEDSSTTDSNDEQSVETSDEQV